MVAVAEASGTVLVAVVVKLTTGVPPELVETLYGTVFPAVDVSVPLILKAIEQPDPNTPETDMENVVGTAFCEVLLSAPEGIAFENDVEVTPVTKQSARAESGKAKNIMRSRTNLDMG